MTNLELVAAELGAAKKKHPKFVDRLLWQDSSPLHTEEELETERARLKSRIAHGTCSFRSVLRCEVAEAVDAYAHGDLANARKEFAQCAAVCIRAMEYNEKEMEEKK